MKIQALLDSGLDGATTNADIRGLIAQYMAYLENEGYYQDSAYLKLIKRLVKVGADICDPEDVKSVIARQPWKESVKLLAVCAYDIMVTRILKTNWNRPRYTPRETTPFCT